MIEVIICPECGTENSLEAESCQNCAASLKGVLPVERPEKEGLPKEDINFLEEPEND
ncbi:MAG: zinc-ribbon domain-containing protein, partial [Anaerolineales bacterium]